MDPSKYQDLFKNEAIEILHSLNNLLVELEKKPSSVDILNEIFRMAHTLKGMAATMNYSQIAKLSHEMENGLDILRQDSSKVSQEICTLFFEVFDALSRMIHHVGSGEESPVIETDKLQHLSSQLNKIAVVVLDPAKFSGGLPEERRMLRIDEEDKIAIAKAIGQGMQVYTSKIVLNKDCVMVEARIFVVLRTLKDAGEILHEDYVLNQVRAAQFGKSFTFFFISKNNIEEVKKEIQSMPDVDFVDFELMPVEQGRDLAGVPALPAREIENPRSVSTGEPLSPPSVSNIRVSLEQLDHIFNLVGELVINRTQLESAAKSSGSADMMDRLSITRRLLSELQKEVMHTRLIPLTTICEQFPRMIRDLAQSEGKQVHLEIGGAEIGLDRFILDEIKDPLIHILRNCVDHGIETPSIRQQKGKNPAGRIKIQVRKEREMVVIEVADDGNGMDIQRIKAKAVSMGLITDEQASRLNDQEAVMLITAPGLSTAEKVTQISGRGVGMDIVKKKIELLGGSFVIDTRPSLGSTFMIRLPASMTIIKALMVKVCHQIYAIPVINILRIVYGNFESITSQNNQKVLVDKNQNIPLICLQDVFGFKAVEFSPQTELSEKIPVIIVDVNNKIAGLIVDGLVNQQEMFVKTVDKSLSKIKGIGGATILGSGKVALVIDVPALI